ncbi:MAG TPA: chemotaxis protein CheB [Anaerolineae bacterium]|nr:chemotaxis protein CheB [Anaerolineae bacterium]
MLPSQKNYHVIVIGGSAGAMTVLVELLPSLPGDFPMPIVIAVHLHPRQDKAHIERLASHCALKVKEADEKEPIQAGIIYLAPPNYHLLIEKDRTFSLSIDERVNYARPSIDVLFETAAQVYGPQAIGIVLTGANNDGADGLRQIKERGGLAIVQDPRTAESTFMPQAALEATAVDHMLSVPEIGKLLRQIVESTKA